MTEPTFFIALHKTLLHFCLILLKEGPMETLKNPRLWQIIGCAAILGLILFLDVFENPLKPSSSSSTTSISFQFLKHASKSATTANDNECPAVSQYAKVTCPVWNHEEIQENAAELPHNVDHRVNFFFRHQNPLDCMKARYLIRPMVERIGFGANIFLTHESGFYEAMYSDR